MTPEKAGYLSPLRRLLSRSAAAVAATDEEDATADESYDDDLDIDEPLAAGKLSLCACHLACALSLRVPWLYQALPCLIHITPMWRLIQQHVERSFL